MQESEKQEDSVTCSTTPFDPDMIEVCCSVYQLVSVLVCVCQCMSVCCCCYAHLAVQYFKLPVAC